MCLAKNRDGSQPNMLFIRDLPNGGCLILHTHKDCGQEHEAGNCPKQAQEIYPEYAEW